MKNQPTPFSQLVPACMKTTQFQLLFHFGTLVRPTGPNFLSSLGRERFPGMKYFCNQTIPEEQGKLGPLPGTENTHIVLEAYTEAFGAHTAL